MPKYDLAGNPIPEPGNAIPQNLPPVAPAGNWGATQPAVWPPPSTAPGGYGNPYGMPQARNTSGEKGDVPPEIAAFKWNWGAWVFSWIWCFAMRLPLLAVTILVLSVLEAVFKSSPLVNIPLRIIGFGIGIYLAIMGHKLAWRNRHFPGGVQEFLEVQRAWMRWGVGFMIAGFVLGLLGAAVLAPVFLRARQQAQMQNGGGYSQPFGNGTPSGNGQPNGNGGSGQ